MPLWSKLRSTALQARPVCNHANTMLLYTRCYVTSTIHFVAIQFGCLFQPKWIRKLDPLGTVEFEKTLCGPNEIPNPLPPPMPKKYPTSRDLCSKRIRVVRHRKRWFPRPFGFVHEAIHHFPARNDRLIFPLCAIVIVKL